MVRERAPDGCDNRGWADPGLGVGRMSGEGMRQVCILLSDDYTFGEEQVDGPWGIGFTLCEQDGVRPKNCPLCGDGTGAEAE